MKLPAVLLFGSLIGFAAASESQEEVEQPVPVEQQVKEDLKEGEQALTDLLGGDTGLLHDILSRLIAEFSKKFDVEQHHLSDVAKRAMLNMRGMTKNELEEAIQALTSTGIDLSDMTNLQEVLSTLKESSGLSGTDGI